MLLYRNMPDFTGAGGYKIVPNFDSGFNKFERTASSIWSSIRNIYSQLNVEIKNHDALHAGGASTSLTPVLYNVTEIAAGITGNSSGFDVGYRDGDKIRLKTCNVKLNLVNNGAGTAKVRVVLFKHYDNFSGIGPKYNHIYDNATGYHTPSSMIQLRNNERAAQYKILATRQIRLSGIGLSGDRDMNNEQTLNLFTSFRKRVGSYVEWEGTLATDMNNGKIGIFVYADTTDVLYDMISRVTYIDN